jgi:hypothetical protein
VILIALLTSLSSYGQNAKKKKGKKGDDKPKEEPKIIIPDFVPHELGPLPISVKVFHLNDLYLIYTDEYAQSGQIKKTLSSLSGQPEEEIKLYLRNKRPIEDATTNHDQQITHETELYAVYKGEKINDILKAANVDVRPNNNPEKPVIKLNPTEQSANNNS